MRSRSQGKQGYKAEKVTLKQETREISEDEEIIETDEEIEEEVEEEEEEEEEEFEGQEMIPSDDGSDSAPEDISFSQSKQEAVDSLSNALKQMQERRRKIKDKRRKHNDLLNDQKKKKLLKLQEKKLSADFLKQVSETSFQKSTAEESVEESKETDPAVHHQHFEEDGGEMEENEDATLIADRFYVMSKQRAERKPHPISANAVSFLQQSLYGKHMNRRPVVNVLATEAKLHQRPADNFKVSKAKKKRRGYKRRSLPIS